MPSYNERAVTRAMEIQRGYEPAKHACVVCKHRLIQADGNYVCNGCVYALGGIPLGRGRKVISFAELDVMNGLPRPLRGGWRILLPPLPLSSVVIGEYLGR